MLKPDFCKRFLVNPIRTGLMTGAKSGPWKCSVTESQWPIS